MSAEPQVVILREIDPEEATCVFCAGLVPDHCEIPYDACPEHFNEAAERIRETGVETTEYKKPRD